MKSVRFRLASLPASLARSAGGMRPQLQRRWGGALRARSGAPLGPAPGSMNRQPPNSGLPPHSDNANFLLTGHLGLVVPDDGVCEFVMVDSEARRWREGGVLLADTSVVHAPRNAAAADRVVLHFTVWHPDLAAAERDGIVRLHGALRAAGG